MQYWKNRLFLILFLLTAIVNIHAQQANNAELKGRFIEKYLNEISGIAASHIYPNTFYIHNDSGDTSRFFAINELGQLKATYYFKGDESLSLGVVDCEDITIGPGPVADRQYIYLADIGDNASMRSNIHVFRFEEPVADSGVEKNIAGEMFTLTYPDGAKDAETIMIDPRERLLYIVSKRGRSVGVYTTPLDFPDKEVIEMQLACKLRFDDEGHNKWIVSGSVSPDGSEVLLKSEKKVYSWHRNGTEPLYTTMQRQPIELHYKDGGQQEAICFSDDGKRYYITGEGKNAGIYEYEIPLQILTPQK